ncbi:MAG: PAS domain S-box protein [Rhodocyclaceae bacterium]
MAAHAPERARAVLIGPRFFPKLTVRRAVVIAVLLGTLLPAGVIGTYLSVRLYRDTLESEVSRQLRRDAEVLTLGVRESLWALDAETAGALVNALMRDPAVVRIEVRDPRLGSFVSREDATRQDGTIHAIDEDIVHRGEIIGHAHVEITDAPFVEQYARQIATLVGMLALQVASSVLLILMVLQWRLGTPLQRLSSSAERLARGELEVPIEAVWRDEIGNVGAQLETTRQALRTTLHSLEQKNRALEVDLRERMRVESALRDREQRLRTLVEQSPLAVIECDLGWHLLDWNEAAMQMFGWRREEVLGRHVSFLIDSAREETILRDVETDLRSTTGVVRRHTHNVHHDGHNVLCRWFNSLIRDANGNPIRIVSIAEDITDGQRAEEEIRRLATVVERTTNLVVLTNAEGMVEWHNDAFAERSGLTPDQILGAPLIQLLRGDAGGGPFSPLIDSMTRGDSLRGLELPCRDSRGQTYWVEAEIQPLRDESGLLTQHVVLLNDITDRRRMTDAMSALARIGAGSAPQLFLEQSLGALARGACAEAAYLAYSAPGHDSTEVVASWASSPRWAIPEGPLTAPSDVAMRLERDGLFIRLTQAHAAFSEDPVLSACEDLDSFVAVAVHDEEGGVIGHLALLFASPPRNLHEAQSLAELGAARAGAEFSRIDILEALQHSEHKFSSIFQHAPIPLFLIRQSDRVYLDVNPSACEVFGFSREEMLGRSPIDLGRYADPEVGEALAEELRERGYVSGFSIRLRSRNGGIRDCQLHVRSVITTEPCWLVATVNITAVRSAQRQVEELNASLERRVFERTRDLAAANRELSSTLDTLQRTQTELIRSEKLAALGSLVAGVAHELNTPIGNSLMVASTLHDMNRDFTAKAQGGLRRSELDDFLDEGRSAADILVRNLQRAGELISSFKQVAVNQTSSQRRVFNLEEVIHEVVLTMQPMFRKTPYGVEVNVESDIWLDSFPGPFGQVISNLIGNAMTHAFDGRETGLVRLTGRMGDDNDVIITCEDDGVGIPPANLGRIFDPFFTTRLGRDGSGLGLNIVHNIVTGVLGGRISVASTQGEGTLFTLSLPLTAPVREG